jgi:large subunit ribosomal protein L35Ae
MNTKHTDECSLYAKGRVLGHKRGKRNSRPNTSLIQIEGVADQKEAQFYLGKVKLRLSNAFMPWIMQTTYIYFLQRVAYVYRAKRAIAGSKVRVIWGSVSHLV